MDYLFHLLLVPREIENLVIKKTKNKTSPLIYSIKLLCLLYSHITLIIKTFNPLSYKKNTTLILNCAALM